MLPQHFWRETRLLDLCEDLQAPAGIVLAGLAGPPAPWPWLRARSGRAGRSSLSAGATRSPRRWPRTWSFSWARRWRCSRSGGRPGGPREPGGGAPPVSDGPGCRSGGVGGRGPPRTIPPAALEGAVVSLYPQRIVSREELLRALTAGGYRGVGQVTEPGEFAIRGGILDCFPPAMRHPVRVEFFGDEVHSLRHFDPGDPALPGRRRPGDPASPARVPDDRGRGRPDGGAPPGHGPAGRRRGSAGLAGSPGAATAHPRVGCLPAGPGVRPRLRACLSARGGADRLGRGFCPGRAGGGAPPGRGGRGRPGARCGTPLPAAGRSLGGLGQFPPGGAGVGRDRTHVVRAPAAGADRRGSAAVSPPA